MCGSRISPDSFLCSRPHRGREHEMFFGQRRVGCAVQNKKFVQKVKGKNRPRVTSMKLSEGMLVTNCCAEGGKPLLRKGGGSVRAPGFAPLDQNAVIVRITSYQNRNPRGTLSSPRLEKPAPFSSLTQLLLYMEALMDQSGFPQRDEERGAFAVSQAELFQTAELDGTARRELATFQLRVLFRQNASWQGSLLWVDEKMDAQFRSVLELVRLIDSALTVEEECSV